MDYVRSVHFHKEYPWIISASDDQTIRIWNWQSRKQIAILAGHSHYVMCARFHPTEDLVVSASLDTSVRVWDISGLKRGSMVSKRRIDPDSDPLQIANDIFGTQYSVKFILEGHKRGVNWVDFHPTLPLVVSVSDDKLVKIWRMSEDSAWETEVLRGHYNYISSAVFHPKENLLLTTSEDNTIRVWEISKRSPIHTHRGDSKYWSIVAHPTLNLFAYAGDSGVVVFKLEKERPPYALYNNSVLYIKNRNLRLFNIEDESDAAIMTIRKPNTSGVPRSIHVNPKKNNVLVMYEGDATKWYRLYQISDSMKSNQSNDSVRGTGIATCWIRHNRFAVLEKGSTISVRDMKNSKIERILPPYPVDNIFNAPMGRIVLQCDDKVVLYDIENSSIVGEEKIPHLKSVTWSSQRRGWGAFICKKCVVITDHNLQQSILIPEGMKVKSGAWDDSGNFIYTTLAHIKYCNPSGDHGIVRSLSVPVYITTVQGDKIYCLDKDCRNRAITIDTTEYTFKQALKKRNFGQVLSMVKNSSLIGNSIINYIQQEGFPEIALAFAQDEVKKFHLALDCETLGTLLLAAELAEKLNEKQYWEKLGSKALQLGNNEIVERCYRKTLAFEQLSFLYLVTGNLTSLNRMVGLAVEKRNNLDAAYQTAVLSGNVEDRIRILVGTGQTQLAYMTAITHGLSDFADHIKELIGQENEKEGIEVEIPTISENGNKLLVPPLPIARMGNKNWPLTRGRKSPFQELLKGHSNQFMNVENDSSQGSWSGSLQLSDSSEGNKKPKADSSVEEDLSGEGWPSSESMEFSEDEEVQTNNSGSYTPIPKRGNSIPEFWARNSRHAADLISSGQYKVAMLILNQEIGAVNFAPMKEKFLEISSLTSVQLSTYAYLPSMVSYISRNPENGIPPYSLPKHKITFEEQVKLYAM
eukprot:TRINITY_DN478_c0_g2_i2.p1 TRINITY_DN478_c0_g2~~TRINITY_DN478_c0_g2_i2.p1  ORF type:complete len:920 (-),score=220.57 TRINITY_DN478_c0_g2_i2:701-3460(-)